MISPHKPVVYEPWALGDAVIAAASIRGLELQVALACQKVWHPLIRRLLRDPAGLELLEVSTPHAAGKGKLRIRDLSATRYAGIPKVLSIRGDPRDYLSAKRLFPGARIVMTGWGGFVARRVPLVDLPYRLGWLAIRNRYDAWAHLLKDEVGAASTGQSPRRDRRQPVVGIHVGAQFRSRQFPRVAELASRLRALGKTVEILAGPRDALPVGVSEGEARRLEGVELVERMQSLDIAVTNDSGPMHVAALAGCRTVAVARVSAIAQWLPPGAVAVCSPAMPRGYGVHASYESHEVPTDWPETEKVVQAVLALAD